MAADANRHECVKLLLDSGADINKASLGGLTPLHVACRNNATDTVQVLLGYPEVDIDAESIERATPDMMTDDPVIKQMILNYRLSKK
jgi:ankyrin repeat protein